MVIARPRAEAGRRAKLRLRRLLPLAVSALFLVPVLFVFFWMVSMSLQTQVEISSSPPTLWPAQPTLQWYAQVLSRSDFLRNTVNSLLIAVASTGLGLVLGLPAAYAIARWRVHGAATLFLLARIVPAISYLIPWFIIAKRLGLSDSLVVLVALHLVVTLPLVVWIMIGFFEALPAELEQAATVDGCSSLQAFTRVALPLVRPGAAAALILAFIASWNNFLFAAVLSGPSTQTLPVVVYGLLSFEQANWGPLAAAATLVALPVLVGALFFQRQLVEGLTAGAIKG